MTNKQEQKPCGSLKFAWIRQAADTAFTVVYPVAYYIGTQTQIWLCVFWQWLRRPLGAAGRALYKGYDQTVLRAWRAATREARRVAEGFRLAGARMRQARARGFMVAVLQALALPLWAVRRHKTMLCRIGNVLMPVAASLVLVATVQYWSGLSFGLELEYDGERLGYIQDETVFDTAAAMVTSRVVADESDTLQVRAPKLTLAVVSKSQVLDEAAVCDKIIQSSGNEFAEATGLYVDGELLGAVTSAEELEAMLQARLEPYRAEGVTAEFVGQVTVQDGLYPISTVVPDTHMAQLLGLDGKASRLKVRTVVRGGYEETIPFKTVTEKDPNAAEGTRRVVSKGKNGTRYITTETVYIDGEVQSVTEMTSTVTQAAVDRVIRIGTKKKGNGVYTPGVAVQEGDGIVTGVMTWPVPAVRNMSQKYHGGHGAIDIANGSVPVMNTPIVAADGGRVTVVNTNPHVGYGIYVVIDHGNGLTTLYAHLNSVSVTTGQAVSRGQEIGRGGNTGWSTGPHLHFEVRENGRCVNPLKYLQP